MRLGNDLENYVAQRFMEQTGKKVRRENHFLFNDAFPFAHALPDRMVVGENAGLECKTTSSWEVIKKCRTGQYPDQWYAQVMHYMMVTGAEKWYLAVLCFGHGFYVFEIERNDDEIIALAVAERDFWHLVETGTPPTADGTESTQEALKTIYAESSGTSCDLGAVRTALVQYEALGKQIAELQELQNAQKATVQLYMRDAERGSCDGYKVRWKTQVRNTFDKKRYEKECGTIPPTYYKQSVSRPFTVTAE